MTAPPAQTWRSRVATGATLPPRGPYWIVPPVYEGVRGPGVSFRLTPECRKRHAYISFRENVARTVLDWFGPMHLLLSCGAPGCDCHVFAALVVRPGPLLHCYDVSRAQLEAVRRMDPESDTADILRFLGYIEP